MCLDEKAMSETECHVRCDRSAKMTMMTVSMKLLLSCCLSEDRDKINDITHTRTKWQVSSCCFHATAVVNIMTAV